MNLFPRSLLTLPLFSSVFSSRFSHLSVHISEILLLFICVFETQISTFLDRQLIASPRLLCFVVEDVWRRWWEAGGAGVMLHSTTRYDTTQC